MELVLCAIEIYLYQSFSKKRKVKEKRKERSEKRGRTACLFEGIGNCVCFFCDSSFSS